MRADASRSGWRIVFVIVVAVVVATLSVCLHAAEAYGAAKYTVMVCNDPMAKSLSYKAIRNVSGGKTLSKLNTPKVKPGEVRKGFETDDTHVECFADLNGNYYYRCFGSALDHYDAGRVTDKVCVAETETVKSIRSKCGIKGTVVYCYLFHRPVNHSLVAVNAPSCTEAGLGRCSACGKEVTLKALGHEFKTVSTKQPTCSETGSKTSVCMRCGEKRVEALPATGKHSFTYKALGNGKHMAICKHCHCRKKAACKFTKNGWCKLCGSPRLPANGVIKVGKHRYKVTGASTAVLYRVNSKTKTLSIPASVRYTGAKYKVVAVAKRAAKGNTNLKKVIKGARLKKVGKDAFRNCKELKVVKLTSGKLTHLGADSFEGCTRLSQFLCKSRISRLQLEKAGVL